MSSSVNPLELRYGVHELLRQKEEGIKHLRAQHNATLRELYLLVSRPHGPGSSFHDVELEDETAEERMSGFEAWKADYPLGSGSPGISAVQLPPLPPLSPPPDVTVFPDEPAAAEQPAPLAISPANPKRPASPFSPQAGPSSPKRPRTRTPLPLTPPPDSPVQAVAPRDVFRHNRSFSPVHKVNAPEWLPQDTYRPVSTPPATPPSIPMPLSSSYSAALPPLPPVPTAQPSRRLKRKDDKQGITKLYTQFAINPLSDAMSQSSKCVLTSDWRVAAQELRHIRAMERIEAKKAENRWSLRQPKKVKGVPMVKAHWDYLLEEMQWLKVDYAEERRWKRMLALEFAYQIVEWHLAAADEKADMMVGGRGWGAANSHAVPGKSITRLGDTREEPNTAEDDVEMMILPDAEEGAVDGHGAAGAVLDEIMAETEGDKEGHEMEAEAQEADKPSKKDFKSAGLTDTTETGTASVPQVDGDVDAEGEADADGEEDAEGEADADGEVDDTAVEGVVGLADIPTAKQAATEVADPSAGGAEGADEDEKAGESTAVRKDTVLANGLILNRRFANVDELMVARKPLLNLSLTEAVVDLSSLPIPPIPTSSTNIEALDPLTPPYLTDLFPDLAVYDGPQPPEDGKMAKRMDEGYTSGNKIAHTSRIMDIRPVFVSTIKPAQNTFEGDWDLSVGPFYEDPRGSTSVGPEVLASTSSIFFGRGIRPPNASHVPMQQTPTAQHLRTTLTWTEEEEKALMRLIATYPYNWSLIADSFNSEIVVIPTEKRSAFDCWEKWYWKWGAGKGQQRPDQVPPNTAKSTAQVPPSAGPPSSTLTPLPGSASTAPPPSAGPSRNGNQTPAATPGGIAVPTLPPSSAGGEGIGEAPPPPGLSKREARAQKNKYEGSKKAIRHQILFDTMRRISRRRDQNKQKASQQPPRVINVHESHAMYLNHPVSTPWDLVEMKYQRDMAGLRARQQRVIQDSQSEILRQAQHQQLLAAQLQQGQAPLSVRSSSQGTPRMAPNGQGLPHMTPNQQQLLSAVAATNAAHSRQASSNGPGAGSPATRAPPTPQQQPIQLAPPGQQQQQGTPIQSTQVQAQMQMLQAQQFAAQQAQAQAQVQAQAHARNQARSASNGDTPMSQTHSSPYPPPSLELPNGQRQGQGQDPHISPSMHPTNSHSSPSQPQGPSLTRVPSMPLVQAQHLRVPSAGSQGSPQMSASVPAPMPPPQQQQQQPGPPNISPQMLQLIVTQLNNNGQQVTPESIRSFHVQMLRQAAQANQAAQQQQQQQQQQQMGAPQGQGPPQMPAPGGQGVPQFARPHSVQPGQAAARNSPKPNAS